MLRLTHIVATLCLVGTVAFSGEPDKPPEVHPNVANIQLEMPVKCGELPKVVNESSGLIKSRKYHDKDVFWTHNDSGDSARIFAVDSKGKLLREVAIPDAKNRDWEEISIDAKGRLLCCDIGDNGRKRPEITLYRLPEPDALDEKEKIAAPEVFTFTYPKEHGAQDAEGLFVLGDAAYLFTKDINLTRCYKLPLPETAPKAAVEAELVGTMTAITLVTGAAISDDGKRLALLTYISVNVLDLPETEKKTHPLLTAPRRARLAIMGQCEAVAWDGDDLLITNEGGTIYRLKNAGVRPKE